MKYLILAILTLSACNLSQPIVEPESITKDVQYCQPAEMNLKELGCIDKYTPYTKKGKSFSQFCIDKQNSGIFLNPKCLSNIRYCYEQDACTGSN